MALSVQWPDCQQLQIIHKQIYPGVMQATLPNVMSDASIHGKTKVLIKEFIV